MSFKLPDPRLADPAFLAGNMTDAQYLSSGVNSDVWRIALGRGQPYVLRVRRLHRDLFTDINHPPRIETWKGATLDARAAQPLALFHATDADGKVHEVGDVQPELMGNLLGLMHDERDARTKKIHEFLTETDGWGRPAGSPSVRYEFNHDAVQKSNQRLWNVADRIASMPLSFFVQMIKDAKEIEENGYGIDPSKGANFMLLEGENRIGFIDLMPKDDFKYRQTPHALATVLWQPANQTWAGKETQAETAKRKAMHDILHAKMIAACDHVRIAYTHLQAAQDKEHDLRARFGLEKPENVRPILLHDNHSPVGHCGVTSKDIVVPHRNHTVTFPAPLARFSL